MERKATPPPTLAVSRCREGSANAFASHTQIPYLPPQTKRTAQFCVACANFVISFFFNFEQVWFLKRKRTGFAWTRIIVHCNRPKNISKHSNKNLRPQQVSERPLDPPDTRPRVPDVRRASCVVRRICLSRRRDYALSSTQTNRSSHSHHKNQHFCKKKSSSFLGIDESEPD